MTSEEQLLKRSLLGDAEAFEEIVKKYQNKVYALTFRYMGNEEDAYDMAQEAFLKAYRSLGTFKGDSSFSTWLYRVTTNVCLDELRRRKRRILPLSLDEPLNTRGGEEVEKELIDQAPTADQIYEQKEFSQYIQSQLDKLKPDYKAILVLRDIMDLSYAEIADVLKCSVGTVKSRLSRARMVFRDKFTG
ncbi:MAG: sigma-70 family RNA polymerase sigma factor [Syntrophomonas sp.]